jgi:hypothetical protein
LKKVKVILNIFMNNEVKLGIAEGYLQAGISVLCEDDSDNLWALLIPL